MDKGQIGLRSLIATRQLLLGKAHLASQRPTTSRRHSGPDTAAATGLSRLDQSGLNHTPFFLRLQPFASKIAITDQDGDFTFAELFKRLVSSISTILYYVYTLESGRFDESLFKKR